MCGVHAGPALPGPAGPLAPSPARGLLLRGLLPKADQHPCPPRAPYPSSSGGTGWLSVPAWGAMLLGVWVQTPVRTLSVLVGVSPGARWRSCWWFSEGLRRFPSGSRWMAPVPRPLHSLSTWFSLFSSSHHCPSVSCVILLHCTDLYVLCNHYHIYGLQIFPLIFWAAFLLWTVS